MPLQIMQNVNQVSWFYLTGYCYVSSMFVKCHLFEILFYLFFCFVVVVVVVCLCVCLSHVTAVVRSDGVFLLKKV